MASPAFYRGCWLVLLLRRHFAQAHHDSTSQESVCAPMPGATTYNAYSLYDRNVVADHDDLVHPTIIVNIYKNILYIYNN